MKANEWDGRAEAYRTSDHGSGADLDTVVEWCEPAAGVRALDVATGGGHVGSRLAAAGLKIVRGAFYEKRHPMEKWLALTGCTGDTAARVRGLLVNRRAPGGAWTDTRVLFKCRTREAH